MEKITNINSSDINIFGDWINSTVKVSKVPFKHITIDNFLDKNYYNLLQNVLPSKPTDDWWKYENPIEVKYALDNFDLYDPIVKNVFNALSHDTVIDRFREMFNIPNLEYDPYCHGGGLHMHPRLGRLNMHLDYEKHPITNKQRRLNIIIYLNEEWNNDWNGDTQLWDSEMKKCMVKSYPKSNTALLFITTENSWHGVPEIILCPENTFRRTLAYYYVSDLENNKDIDKKGADKSGYRTKAVFVKRPNDVYDERMEQLYRIRPHRLITPDDMKSIYPEWTIH